MNIVNLIKLLPYYFTEKDSYKVEGKGILERYLEVCGTYFKEELEEPIGNLLDIIDLDSPVSDAYLNFIWEFLGCIPYAQGSLVQENNWAKYNNNVANQVIWKTQSDLTVPRARKDIIKYAISLYKIRGTLDFYNILLSFYGLSCTIHDTSGDNDKPGGDNPNSSGSLAVPYYDRKISYDFNTHYDLTSDCNSCAEVNLVVSVPHNLPGVDPSKATLDASVASRILLLLNRFRPINVVEFSPSNTEFKLIETKGFPMSLPLVLT